MSIAALRARLPPVDGATPEALLEAFLGHVQAQGLALYPAQEEAILELFSGSSVILATPTGSGKSLVAEAMCFGALARDEVAFYTAPIKALVSEKFFAMCRLFGPDDVGMLTGDAAINPGAPIVCCTAEILANLALRDGERADVQHVVMDEFHYYSDRDRGVAWQVPLLTLPQARFLLMSATLGDTTRFEEEIAARTGAPCVLVRSDERPVPLDFEYRETPIHETIADLLESARAPVYVVHFSQRAASERAQSLMSVDFLTRDQKEAIKAELRGFRFDTAFGKELRRFVHHGVGVHHAGLLPKYRLVVEKLAQSGHLKVICGTDTLGVGVNIPIRTVLFTQLCKYDGDKTRVLSVRDFKQIAGRAGRRGFDTRGAVVAQAPEHAIENKQLEDRASGDPKKLRKLVRRKPPERGYAHWERSTFERLIASDPEPLASSFEVSHAMLLHVLERPGDGCLALRGLLRACHESPKQRRRHARRAISMFRSLMGAGIVELRPEPDEDGRYVQLNEHLQPNFSIHQTLGLWVVDVLSVLDPQSPDYPLDVLTLVEAVQEDPAPILRSQLDALKGALVAELKAEGVEYDERMKQLDQLEHPKPLRELVYGSFEVFAQHHPWVSEQIRPKSIARDMWERAATFHEYVKEYGLARSEGLVLRYLSDVYRALNQTVPESAKTPEVVELVEWLGAVVRQVDSSLLDEWERLREPAALAGAPAAAQLPRQDDVTANVKDFTVLVRSALFRMVRLLARRAYGALAEELVRPDGSRPWSPERLAASLAPYFEEHAEILTDASARGPAWFRVEPGRDTFRASQTLLDPEGHGEWRIDVSIDLARSREEQRPVLELLHVGP